MFKLMKIKDHLYMPPLKKYERYGHFPWKLVIHFLIVLLTTCEVLFIVNNNTTYTFNQYTVFNKFFLNPEASGGDGGLTLTFTLFSTKSLKNYIKSTVSNYYSINSLAIDNYDYFYEDDGLRNPPKLLVSYFDNEQALDRGYKFEYKLNQNNLGPFDDENVEDFIETVQEFYVTFKLKHKLEKYQKTPRDCYVWNFKQRYNFSHHGSIIVELSTDNYSCESRTCNL